jgi:hypothetical protein
MTRLGKGMVTTGILAAALIAATLAAPPAAAQWGGGFGGGGSANQSDVQYVMNADGTYSGKKNTITGGDTNGTHYSCSPTSGGLNCNACGQCHTSTQVQSKTYTARYDWKRHATLYFPKLVANLPYGRRIAWGDRAMIAYRNTEVVVTSRDRLPVDLVIFPAGSKIVLNPAGRASFVALPPTGEPTVPKR